MATTKSSAKSSSGKRSAPLSGATPAKAKPAVTPEAKAKAQATPPTKTSTSKPARTSARKPAGVPQEQRQHYVEMAAYYIAERRGFAPGNPLEDWVQAEAEIDRLLAEGLLGG
jgi:hypothetical protein